MTSLKNNFIQASTALYLWLSGIKVALAIDLGEVPGEFGGGGADSLRETIINVMKEILLFMALVATIVIIIAGIRMVISQGDEGGVEKAKKTILWAIIGLVLILIAGGIVQVIANI